MPTGGRDERRWFAVAIVLVVSGCSSAAASVGPGGQASWPAIGLSAPQLVTQPFDPMDTVRLRMETGEPVMTRSNSWELVRADFGSRTVTIAWTDSGSARCGLNTVARVHESSEAVVIQLPDDPRPPVPGGVYRCAASGIEHGGRVRLARPLGARRLVQPCSPDGMWPDATPVYACR